MNNFARALNIGWTMAALIVGPVILGIKIDQKLGTKVVFTLIMTLLGCAAAFYEVYTLARGKK